MTHIRADRCWVGKADLGIHVGAVHIDLAAILVDDPANILDALFEHAMRRRIGYHQCGKLLLVRFGFRAKIVHIDVPACVRFNNIDSHPGHIALAGFVPCAEAGMGTRSRCESPLDLR